MGYRVSDEAARLGTLFNIGADFFLYDLARLPVFRYLTPVILQMMNDIVYLNLKDSRIPSRILPGGRPISQWCF